VYARTERRYPGCTELGLRLAAFYFVIFLLLSQIFAATSQK
jgi:hypothetical protein